MPQEYTPSGSPIAYTVPAYADVVDGPTAFKSFADDVATGFAAKLAGVKADTAPATPATNDVWLDTSGTAGVWKIWNGSAWVSFSGGAPAAVTSTTGSPTITSDASYTYYVFNANGSIIIGTAGVVDSLLVGGGSGGHPGVTYRGLGGWVVPTSLLLPAATYPIVVGAGGALYAPGGNTTFAGVSAFGGGYMDSGGGPISAVTASLITGSSVDYGGSVATPTANRGQGRLNYNGNGSAGVVVVRVAK